MKKFHTNLKQRDIAEIVIGSVVLGFPATVTEEIWILGESIPGYLAFAIFILSLFFISMFVYGKYHKDDEKHSMRDFYIRTLAVYFITFTVCALILLLFQKFPIIADPAVAIKRCIIVSLPASFAATMADSIG